MVKCSDTSRYEYWTKYRGFEVPSQEQNGAGIASVCFDVYWHHYCEAVDDIDCDPDKPCSQSTGGSRCKGTFTWRHAVQRSEHWGKRTGSCGAKIHAWIKKHPCCRVDEGCGDGFHDCWKDWAESDAAKGCWPEIPFGGNDVHFPGNGESQGFMDEMFPGMSEKLNEKIEDLIKGQGCKCRCQETSSLTNDGTSPPPQFGELPDSPFQHTTFILPNGRTSK